MHLFVLLRLYILDENRDAKNVIRAFSSLRQAGANMEGITGITLLINDDSPVKQRGRKWLADEVGKFNKVEINTIIHETSQLGSAMALYSLRREFIKSANDDDVAVILDQDDELTADSLKTIVQTFHKEDADVVISDFDMDDPDNIGIIMDKGRQHTNFLNGYQGIEYADSLCWTKNCRKRLLEKHLQDLQKMMAGDEGLKEFYCEHKAYDDFIDFGLLLYKDVRIARNPSATHIYHKHSTSITGTPNLHDFCKTRPLYLIAVINLVFSISKENLLTEAYTLLFKYITVKVVAIEAILQNYRQSFYKGSSCYGEIAASTYPDSFIHQLTYMAFNADENTRRSFKLFIKCANDHNDDSEVNLNNARFILLQVCSKKVKNKKGNMEEVRKQKLDVFKGFIESSKALKHKRFYLWFLIIIFGIFFVVAIYKSQSKDMIIAVGTILAGFITFFANALWDTNKKINAEDNMRSLYCSEFIDLVRHLQAGCNILIQLKKELDDGATGRPAPVHFRNLCVPDSSHIFSNDIIKISPPEYMDQISRIKVNVRNINNSGLYMEQYALSPSYNSKTMARIIEWELTRYFGHIVTFMFVQNEGKFRFPEPDELDSYLENDRVRNEMTRLFIGFPADERVELVNYYIEAFKNNQRIKRDVVIED